MPSTSQPDDRSPSGLVRTDPLTTDPLALVTDALGRLRFGDIRLTVHEGRLVQIDVTEKTRMPVG